MRIEVLPDGTLSIDVPPTESASQVAGIIKELRGQSVEARTAAPSVKLVRQHRSLPAAQKAPAELNDLQYATWEFLVDNDTPGGVHLTAVARGLGISDTAAGCRLRRLQMMGYTSRVSVGRYRALEGRVSA